MINYSLPKSLVVNGKDYKIRWHTEAALDVITALSDPDLSNHDKAIALLTIIYIKHVPRADQEEAIKQAYWFLGAGDTSKSKPGPKIVDWEKDFPLICSAVNRVVGYEIRGNLQSLHWWTFLAAYMEIGGDCTFAQFANIRKKLARGEKLEKWEREFYLQNRERIDIVNKASEAEQDFLHDVFGIKKG